MCFTGQWTRVLLEGDAVMSKGTREETSAVVARRRYIKQQSDLSATLAAEKRHA